MIISQPYTFDFPTVGSVNLGGTLSPIATNWAGRPNLSFSALGAPGAYDTVTKQQPDNLITGIDIPVLIWKAKPSKGVVFILAQDPLRKKSDYPTSINWRCDIVVSLPFGVHVDNVVKVINGTCDYILGCGYDVYITDCTKIYSKGQSKKTNLGLLQAEINCLNSKVNTITHYIAFGKRAQDVLGKLPVPNNSVIPIVHPSGSANSAWKKNYPKSGCTDCDKIRTITQILANEGIK